VLRTIEGDLDSDVLRRALTLTVNRHDILRTSYSTGVGALEQMVAPHLTAEQQHQLLRVYEDVVCTDVFDSISSIVTASVREPFLLSMPPHVRATVIRVRGERRAIVCFVFHHICIDGISEGLFVREVWQHYCSCVGDSTFSPSRPPLQYKDFATWQRTSFASASAARLDADLEYWRRELDGYQSTPVVYEQQSEPGRSRQHGHVAGAIDSLTANSLCEFSAALGTSPFVAILAALQFVVGRQVGVDDVVVGIPFAGRDRPELDDMMGYFVNMLSVR
jgi:hypothetical protein